MEISEIILNKIKRDHRGKENAVKRRDLLNYIQSFDSLMTDRHLRIIVKTIPQICTFERGYFIATSKEEVDYSIEYLKKKIFPLWEDIKQIKNAYSQYYSKEQLELFS